MFLHTKLSSTECRQRLSQPYLSDPDIAGTSGDGPGNKQIRKEDDVNWMILINANGNEFEVQELNWIQNEQEQFQIDKSNLNASFSLSLWDCPGGGTDIECRDVRSLKKITLLGYGPMCLWILFHFAIATSTADIQITPGYVMLFGFILLLMLVTSYYARRPMLLRNTLAFTSRLLEAKEVLFYKNAQALDYGNHDKPTIQQSMVSYVTQQTKNILHTNMSMDECVKILSQPFLSDPDSADTDNIIKRPTVPQVQIDNSSKRAIVVNVEGNNFDVQERYWQLRGRKEFSIKDSRLRMSQKCSLNSNSTGGTDIKYDTKKPIGQIIASVVVLVLLFLFKIFMVPAIQTHENENYFMVYTYGSVVAFLFLGMTIVKFLDGKKLIKFVADLLDAE